MSGAALARAAETLVGTRFRLHGRDPSVGLDCVGLLAAALASIGRPINLPSGYRLRNRTVDALLPDPEPCGFVVTADVVSPGDIALVQAGPAQLHLAIAAGGGGWIHAHAGLRRVVHQPGPPPGPIIHRWRIAPAAED
ncbi:MAG: NlpC/P60 family protein [Novosphingobium sp.]